MGGTRQLLLTVKLSSVVLPNQCRRGPASRSKRKIMAEPLKTKGRLGGSMLFSIDNYLLATLENNCVTRELELAVARTRAVRLSYRVNRTLRARAGTTRTRRAWSGPVRQTMDSLARKTSIDSACGSILSHWSSKFGQGRRQGGFQGFQETPPGTRPRIRTEAHTLTETVLAG